MKSEGVKTGSVILGGEGPVFVTTREFAGEPRVSAVFSTRLGGFSTGHHAELNFGYAQGELREVTDRNYLLMCEAVGVRRDRIAFNKQVHGNSVRVVRLRDYGGEPLYSHIPEGDAMITDEPGIALTAFFADCVPILVYDPAVHAVGAIHAGWRGMAADIPGEAIKAMTDAFGSRPADMVAAVGPSISADAFEVGEEVADEFARLFHGDEIDRVVLRRPGWRKPHVDLWSAAAMLLERAGIPPGGITVTGECTYSTPERYYSHRRMGKLRGNQMAVIVLR